MTKRAFETVTSELQAELVKQECAERRVAFLTDTLLLMEPPAIGHSAAVAAAPEVAEPTEEMRWSLHASENLCQKVTPRGSQVDVFRTAQSGRCGVIADAVGAGKTIGFLLAGLAWRPAREASAAGAASETGVAAARLPGVDPAG